MNYNSEVLLLANIQKFFNEFHDNIKIEYEDNELLRENREKVITHLKDNISEEAYSFTTFNQGSYSMYTGIYPLDDEDYDIDVGVVFEMSRDECDNPVQAKEWVLDALELEFDVKIKNPCVTVSFKESHVDLAVYAKEDNDYYLSKGKVYSETKNKKWEISEPKDLKDKIQNHFDDKRDREQFRRVIRYLKRWKDLKFKGEVNRPSGIGLTISALEYFTPNYEIEDYLNDKREYNDLKSIIDFVEKIEGNFTQHYDWEEQEYYWRLKVILPVQPYIDVYEKVSNKQMNNFKEKLGVLKEKLIEAKDIIDNIEATKVLQSQFGKDFPEATVESSALKTQRSAIIDDYPSA